MSEETHRLMSSWNAGDSLPSGPAPPCWLWGVAAGGGGGGGGWRRA